MSVVICILAVKDRGGVMLDILLLILKIIGIILAVILGLVILILLTVLFAPVRYNIRASYYSNKPSADVRVTALFRLVRFKLTYAEELKYRAKVLFFTVYSSDKMSNSDEEAVSKEQDSAKAERGAETAYSTEIMRGAETAYSTETMRGAETAYGVCTNEAGSKEKYKEKHKEPRKENFFKKLIRKLRELVERIKELYKSLKDKAISIIDSIRTKKEDLSGKIDSFYEVINDEDNRELVRFLWEQLKKLLRIIKPKKGKLYIHYGMDNPETTGKIAMYLAVLYGWLGIDINILPDFEQKIMEGEIQLKGSIRLFGIIVIALKVYTNKQFKKVVLKK